MAAKRPASKATKVKKTVARKAAPVKKAAPVRVAPVKKTAAVRSKPETARAPAKAAAKPAVKPATKAPSAPAKPTKAAPVATAIPQPAPKPAVKPAPATAAAPPKVPMPLRPAVNRSTEADQTSGNDVDDTEGQEAPGGNLLAGPRNVKPYIARRGEQYMNKEQLDHFRLILESWKRDLMQEVDRTVLHMKDEAANFPDPNDRATQESEFSLELRTRDRERKLIRKIEEAIKRIDDGSYGYCVETGEEIGVKRLEARPVATLSLEAQERRERREKQYGDRDDRYR
jgi:DnaK suppressor protein